MIRMLIRLLEKWDKIAGANEKKNRMKKIMSVSSVLDHLISVHPELLYF
jgi:hypothetical protein